MPKLSITQLHDAVAKIEEIENRVIALEEEVAFLAFQDPSSETEDEASLSYWDFGGGSEETYSEEDATELFDGSDPLEELLS